MSEVLSAVLLLGIFVVAVGVAMMWAMPIVQKGSDKVAVEILIDDAKKVGDALSEVALEGGSKVVELKGEPIIRVTNDSVYLTTKTSQPIFPPEYTAVVGDYPWSFDSFYVESTFRNQTYANATFSAYGKTYLVELYNTTGAFDLCCINSSCGKEGDYANGFKVVEIDDSGNYVFLEGEKRLTTAVFGVDKLYSIVGISSPSVNQYETSLVIVPKKMYRDKEYTIHIQCGFCYGKGDLHLQYLNSSSKDIYIRVDIV